ncbi:MAG: hypothetical protein JSV64_00320 [Candidatus Bathyarchaeota archaeon]|nr:MAG: hypothetical protein JSV64_00320 [Candidatus Bathyarchaeota archaeon]
MKTNHLIEVMLATVFASCLFVGLTSSASVYDPWCDLDGDGDIDIFDVARIASCYGTSGEPLKAKAALEYDSGWINITDKRGQAFEVSHGLSSTDFMVDTTGRVSVDDGSHQNHYGLATYVTTASEWNQTYGGARDDEGWSVVQTSDGGFAIAGTAKSFGAADSDFWLVKTDASGNHLWNQTYGGTSHDWGCSIVQTLDGGYIIAGRTYFSETAYDFRLVRVDALGNHLWNQTYGGTGYDNALSVVQTEDGGFAVVGVTESLGASSDVWLVKTDAGGNLEWNQTYGGTSYEAGWSVVQTNDGGYAIAGTTGSLGAGATDAWLVRVDALGNHLWNQTYGGTSWDEGYSMVQTLDGGFAIAGYTESSGAGAADFWLVKTDAVGNLVWSQAYGGIDNELGLSVVQTMDGGYAIAGHTYSFGAGGIDVWLVKTDAGGNHTWSQTYGGTSEDCGYSVVQTLDGGYAIAGYTDSFGAGGEDVWLIRAYEPGKEPLVCVEYGLAWTASTENTITLYRGEDDPYWNYVRVRIWRIEGTP